MDQIGGTQTGSLRESPFCHQKQPIYWKEKHSFGELSRFVDSVELDNLWSNSVENPSTHRNALSVVSANFIHKTFSRSLRARATESYVIPYQLLPPKEHESIIVG
jgi:hypothetical protein